MSVKPYKFANMPTRRSVYVWTRSVALYGMCTLPGTSAGSDTRAGIDQTSY